MDAIREKTEHLLDLRVMRLTRPTLISPVVVTTDIKDLPNNEINALLKSELTSVPGSETISSGEFLLLPQCFGSIYLGETFVSYICVHNDSTQIAKDVTVKVILETDKNQSITLSVDPPNSTDLVPGATVDEVIQHEVKEFGPHILVCEVSYCSGTLSSDLLSFRKFFKFEVYKPLDLKTKLYTAESDEVYLEAQVQNTTSGPLILERVSLEASQLFQARRIDNKETCGDFEMNVMAAGGCKQFLYCLTPYPTLTSDLEQLTVTTNIGKLDIAWRSNLGERGRLQTSALHRIAPNFGDLRLSVIKVPNVVYLEEKFELVCRIINTSQRRIDLNLQLEDTANFAWCGQSGIKLGSVEPGGSLNFTLEIVPLSPGLQKISGVRIRDLFLDRTHEYDDLTQVFVSQRN